MNRDVLLRDYFELGAGYDFGDSRFFFSDANFIQLIGPPNNYVHLMAQSLLLGHITWICEPLGRVTHSLTSCCQIQTPHPKYFFHRLLTEVKRRQMVVGFSKPEQLTAILTDSHTFEKHREHISQITSFDLSLLRIHLFVTSNEIYPDAYPQDNDSLQFKKDEIGYRVRKYLDLPLEPVEGQLGIANFVTAKHIASKLGISSKEFSYFARHRDLPGAYRFGNRLCFDEAMITEFMRSEYPEMIRG